MVTEEIRLYCENHSTLPSAICAELESYTRQHVPNAGMLTGALVGSFLGMLVRLVQAKRILEIGTYTGYSALVMAEHLPTNGELITLDINTETNALAQSFWNKSPHGRKIQPLIGPALESIKTLRPEFDLIFIDADKTNYLNYLEQTLPLLSQTGLIVADNCLWSGKVLNKSIQDADTVAIRNFNTFISESSNLTAILVPLRDGLFLIRKK